MPMLPLLVPRRESSSVTFATPSGLGITAPPPKPAAPKKFGSYCFRATCGIHDDSLHGCPVVAKLKGYDRSPEIGRDTEEVCRVHARTMGGRMRCGDAEVVLLPGTDMECSGQMMFVMDGVVRRLV